MYVEYIIATAAYPSVNVEYIIPAVHAALADPSVHIGYINLVRYGIHSSNRSFIHVQYIIQQ
jgi:hypothetical protein